MDEREAVARKKRLARVGDAAISAMMTDQEVLKDPAGAFHIALAAIRATIRPPQ